MEDCTRYEGILREAACTLYQSAYRRTAIEIVVAGMEHPARDADRILIALLNGIDNERVAISEVEIGHLKLRDIVG